MDYRGLIRGDGRHAVTLWYASVPLARLLTDVDAMARGLRGDAVMRVYTNRQEAAGPLPYCAQLAATPCYRTSRRRNAKATGVLAEAAFTSTLAAGSTSTTSGRTSPQPSRGG